MASENPPWHFPLALTLCVMQAALVCRLQQRAGKGEAVLRTPTMAVSSHNTWSLVMLYFSVCWTNKPTEPFQHSFFIHSSLEQLAN